MPGPAPCLVAVSVCQLAAAGLGGIGRQRNLGCLAVFKGKEQIPLVVGGHRHKDRVLAAVHAQLCRQVIPQHTGLGIVKVRRGGLVDLALIGEEQQLTAVGGSHRLGDAVPFLELLIRAHAQRLVGDLLEVAPPG